MRLDSIRPLAQGILTLWLAATPIAQAKAPAIRPVKAAPKAKPPTKDGADKGMKEPDRADLRAAANLDMYGRATPEYLDFKARAAEKELRKWGRLIPGTKAHRAALPTGGIPEKAWTNIGPNRGQGQLYIVDSNIADTGRPTVILPHPTNPNTLYVGYAGGGLWRSTDADVTAAGDWTWTPVTDGLPGGSPAGNLSVGGAAFKPEDPNTLYLALGDMEPGSADSTAEGRGFFFTTDGGDTWTRGGTLGATTRVKTVLALPGNLVLVSGNQGLFRSADGGVTFTAIASGPLSGTMGWDILPLANGDLVMGYQAFPDPTTGVAPGGVAYSTDAGLTWTASTYDTNLTTYGLRRIGMAAHGSTVYGLFEDSNYAFQRGIMKSIDNGRTWAWFGSLDLFNVPNDGGQASYNHMIAVDPLNVNKVFVGTNMSLYRSSDGGVSWERMTHWMGNDRHYIHADFHVHGWMQASTGPKTLFLGTDGGLSVVRNPDLSPIPTFSGGLASDPTFIDTRRNRNIATQLVYHIGSTTAVTPVGSNQRVIVGLQDQGTRIRTESSVATQSYDMAIGGDGFGCLIHPYDGDKILGSYYYDNIYSTSNGGVDWTYASGIDGANDGNSAPFFTRIGLDLSDPTGNRVYTYSYTVPYVSNDFGVTWVAMPTDGLVNVAVIRNIAASPLTPDHVAMAVNGGRVAITTDGSTWSTIDTAAFPNNGLYMNCVAFDTADPQILYSSSVALNATTSHIWKSIDGGSTWTAMDEGNNGFPFGVPVHMVKVDPLDHATVYAGTDLGLYRSTDSGATWTRFGTGLPLVSVRDIYLAPDGTFMRLGTHGRGVWEMQGVTDAYAPLITSQPRTMIVNQGDPGMVGVVAVGLPAPTFQWQVSTDGVAWSPITTGGTANTYAIPPAAATDDGKQFRVLVTNTLGTVISNAATLWVIPAVAPEFTTHPASLTQIAGLRVDLNGLATGTPDPTYQWQRSADGTTWADISGATDVAYRFYPTPADAHVQFRLVATNLAGIVPSDPATLTLTPHLQQVLVNPDFEVLPVGTAWTWSDPDMQSTSNVNEGLNSAYFCDWTVVHTDWAYQTLAIPANPTSAKLTFWMQIVNADGIPASQNTLIVKVQDNTGKDLATLGSFSSNSAGFDTFAKTGAFDLRPFAGQTVRVFITSTQTDLVKGTAFYVDDVNLIVNTTVTDLNGDGVTDAYDLLELLKRYGSTAAEDLAKADLNADGQIDDADLAILLSAF